VFSFVEEFCSLFGFFDIDLCQSLTSGSLSNREVERMILSLGAGMNSVTPKPGKYDFLNIENL